jgi:hypothetical protein
MLCYVMLVMLCHVILCCVTSCHVKQERKESAKVQIARQGIVMTCSSGGVYCGSVVSESSGSTGRLSRRLSCKNQIE